MKRHPPGCNERVSMTPPDSSRRKAVFMATKSIRTATDCKPSKPHPDFPLFPHSTGRWTKKVRGKFHYFGKVAEDPNGQVALGKWLDGDSRLTRPRRGGRRGRRARAAESGPTRAPMCPSSGRRSCPCRSPSGRSRSRSSRSGPCSSESSPSGRFPSRTGLGPLPPGSGLPCFANASARAISSFAFE